MPFSLHALGFCGVDESVDPDLLALISARFPAIEWGVLFRPDKEGEPRFPRAPWVARLSEAAAPPAAAPDGAALAERGAPRMRLAGHLCGARAREVCACVCVSVCVCVCVRRVDRA
jgi:hypothetical protein